MLYLTDFSTASKMLNLNNPTQGTQCGVNDNPNTQRIGDTRH
jgi:hypothetical protein